MDFLVQTDSEDESSLSDESLDNVSFEKPVSDHIENKFTSHQLSNRKREPRCDKEGDKDRRKPFYVPRNPSFFHHDLRLLEEDDDDNNVDFDKDGEKDNNFSKEDKKNKKDESNCWKHDKYVEDEQKPKSTSEIIETYGYDIRNKKSASTYSNCSKQIERDVNDNNVKNKHSNNDKYKQRNHYEDDKTFKSAKKDNHIEFTNISEFNVNQNRTENIVKNERDYSKHIKNERAVSPDKLKKLCDDIQVIHITDVNSTNKSFSNKKEIVPVINQYKNKKDASEHSKSMTEKSKKKMFAFSQNEDVLPHGNQIFKNDKTVDKSKRALNRDDYYCKLSGRVHAPINIEEKFKKLNDIENIIEKNCQNSNNKVVASTGNSHRQVTFNCENFSFPDPPDLSANHLTPWLSQQQYILEPYFQQDVGVPLQWGYYGQSNMQPNYYGSSIAIIQQQYSWQLPSTLITSPVNTNPYYVPQDNVSLKKEEKRVEFISSSGVIQPTASSTPVKNIHRYSVMRSQLHSVPNSKSLQQNQ